MDWIRNNKFMAGFLAFMLVGVGVLGYLLYTSYGNFDEVSQEYDKQVTELQRLQKLKPFPDAKGLEKFAELRQTYLADVSALQTKLAAYEPALPATPMTPVEFGEKLRRTVEDISKSAETGGVGLPANFYMGFDNYRGAPPDAAATQQLSRQLDLVEKLVRLMIDKKVASINLIKRAPLPKEPGYGGAIAAAAPTPAARGAGRNAPSASELIVRYPVEIAFTAQPSNFREVLNQITSSDQLYVIRALEVKNKAVAGPLRVDPTAANAAAGGTGAPAAQPAEEPPAGNDPSGQNQPLPQSGKEVLRYVVGLEKLDADLLIDLVRVEPPAAVK